MFDALAPLTAEELECVLGRLAAVDGAGATESEQIDIVAVLEKLKGAAAAAQARVTDSLAIARSRREAERGVPAAKRCQGLAAEVALARRCSPHRGAQSLGLSRALVREMPHTHELLSRGEISEWRATVVVRETAVLSVSTASRSTLSSPPSWPTSVTARQQRRLEPSVTASTPARRSVVLAARGPTATSACDRPQTR